MQIRIQGRKAQLIRAVYSSELKRSVQKVIAGISPYATSIPADVAALLTPDELAQVQAWIDERSAKQSDADARYACSSLARTAIAAAKHLQDHDIKDSEADAIWEALGAVQRALKKAGHPRPKKAVAVVPDSRQARLPVDGVVEG